MTLRDAYFLFAPRARADKKEPETSVTNRHASLGRQTGAASCRVVVEVLPRDHGNAPRARPCGREVAA